MTMMMVGACGSRGTALFRTLYRRLQGIQDVKQRSYYLHVLKDEFRQHGDETDPDRISQIEQRSMQDVDWIVTECNTKRRPSA
ncbi:hypothetical protein PTSG_12314 [Salpingoeca rosetta]|uniref:Complex 1 LYR protein domain-containing protein n=1 Tax=Salpingoeca rosetta (strain ATCC 50818 / BSB-021) TaxID=946362 RepID=F2UAE2_SALR5|nr:uncharacterized protein PTSG_12314 [Salpingoeca rosetta]EGD73717.1 hypothetical protein PTSG_12314 [Salpingoeca rosetta]|eukprot:XP_004993998.1 hypothetical protein PTSG_12314 [Salpingoeca rosetta]